MRAALLGIITCLTLLAGCGGKSVEPAPYNGPSKTPSTSASTSAPTGTSDAAAMAFVAHFMDVLSKAGQTGDTSELASLGAPRCRSCAVLVSNITRTYKAGGRFEGSGFRAHDTTLVKRLGDSGAVVDSTITFYPQVEYKTADATPKHNKGGEVPSRFSLVVIDGSWRLANWATK